MKDRVLYICDPNKNTKCAKTICVHNPCAAEHLCRETFDKEFSIDGIPVSAICPHCYRPYDLVQNQKDELITVGKVVIDCSCNKLFTIKDDGETIFVK